jgi:hypothetical protein
MVSGTTFTSLLLYYTQPSAVLLKPVIYIVKIEDTTGFPSIRYTERMIGLDLCDLLRNGRERRFLAAFSSFPRLLARQSVRFVARVAISR